MPTVHLNHSHIHYEFDESAGADKPVLVLSNSLGTSMAMWEPQRPLSAHYRVLRYDTRGHGGSSSEPGPYTMAQLGQDVIALMDHLGIAKAHFCGLSMGGMVGMHLAIHAPQRFDKLVLANTNAFTASPEFWQKRIATLIEQDGIASIADGVMVRFFSPTFASQHPDTVARFKADMLATSLTGYTACCAAIRDMDFRAGLPSLKHPVLVIVGNKDQAAPPEQGHFLASQVQSGAVLALDAAHISNVEAADAFSQAVRRFLG
ncbi:3-oxoadipate enol-lactonase [Comamonas sp.]|uniref:3-oxoadipate enol-lactonase n=1 Tax=Comamonas sp. TaxID=34028 RepID=UPI0028989D5C|nr:3-oxoadipate enol-lactonase [Comamonas sp.]